MHRSRAFLVAAAALLCAPVHSVVAQGDSSLGAVVVTGAPSGIGRKITERLAAKGYFVYAGARTSQEMADLNAIKNVQAVRLDVTSPTDIAAAVSSIQGGKRPLRGVVNNAGVVGVAPLIEMSEQELNFVLNVN